MDEPLRDFQQSVLRIQLVLADRLGPPIRELAVTLGRWALDTYLMWPWYQRHVVADGAPDLAFDLRTGRFLLMRGRP